MGGTDVTGEIKKEVKIVTEDGHSPKGNDNSTEIGGIIELLPNNEEFRNRLLKHRQANYKIIYKDRSEEEIWNANKITSNSSIIGNIRSGPLRNWKEKGIIKAIFEVKDE